MNISIVRVPGELTTVFVTNLTAFNLYAVTVTAFTGSVEDASSDGKVVGPIVFQTLEEGTGVKPYHYFLPYFSAFASCLIFFVQSQKTLPKM